MYSEGVLGEFILCIVLSCLTIFVWEKISIATDCSKETYPIYEYIDLDGNVREGVDCSYKVDHYKSGGQGTPICTSGDGAITFVKQYRIVRYTKQPYCNLENKGE